MRKSIDIEENDYKIIVKLAQKEKRNPKNYIENLLAKKARSYEQKEIESKTKEK